MHRGLPLGLKVLGPEAHHTEKVGMRNNVKKKKKKRPNIKIHHMGEKSKKRVVNIHVMVNIHVTYVRY